MLPRVLEMVLWFLVEFCWIWLDRLTSGPNGTSTYGDSNHLDAVTSTTGGYTARYSAGGAMTCRAPTSSLTCTGTPTGQPLTYDALDRQLSWQNQANSPTTTASYGYDGAGSRVEQQVTSSGTTTTTYYIGSYEEVSVTGSTTTTTKYYATKAGTALAVNGTVSYLLTNGLSSVTVALSSLGSITATQLFTPYGSVRYSSGTMPTSKGFTGQRLDGSGLNYFNARYYDSTVGQFTSADTVQGLNRYAYTGGNPETRTDPSGNCFLVCAVIGAAVGFVGDLAVQEVSSIASGNGFTTHPDWGQALTWGAAGAIIGGTGGAAFFADSLLISTSVPVLGGIDAASTTAVGASAAYGGFANSATQFVIGLSNGLGYTKNGPDSWAHNIVMGGLVGAASGATLPGLGGAGASRASSILMSSGVQGLFNFGGNILDDIWNGQPLDQEHVGMAFLGGLFTGISSLPGSYLATGPGIPPQGVAAIDGIIQGVMTFVTNPPSSTPNSPATNSSSSNSSSNGSRVFLGRVSRGLC